MRKKDEMEQEIANKSVKISWGITVAALIILGITHGVNSGESNNIFFVLASVAVGSYIFLERYYLSKVDEKRSFTKFILVVIILIAIMLGIAWWSGS